MMSSKCSRRSSQEYDFRDNSSEEMELEDHGTLIEKCNAEKDASSLYMLALTSSVGGLQVVWSVVLSNGTPYLISLGLSKSCTALVWVAAPLCGLIIQPVAGAFSDRSRNSWGRRRPFIAVGTICVVTSLLTLAWCPEIVHFLVTGFGNRSQSLEDAWTVAFATFLVWFLNIAIQPVQMGIRVLIVENVPRHQQTQASAWASYLTGVGNIVGYITGFSTLPEVFGLPNMTQFQGLCVLASIALVTTVGISCFSVHETDPWSRPPLTVRKGNLLGAPKRLFLEFKMIPPKIRRVCHIQFYAWMGWFPFLYYSATFVLEERTNLPLARQSATREEAIHIGTLACLLFATVAILTNVTLSSLLKSSSDCQEISRRRPSWVLGFHFSITQAWTCAHVFFAICMLATIFVGTWIGGTILIASAGISWALTVWVPFAIIGEELRNGKTTDAEDRTGEIMSIHNMAISAPQIVAALLSSGVFWIAGELGSLDGTGWVLRIGACATLIAAYLSSESGEQWANLDYSL